MNHDKENKEEEQSQSLREKVVPQKPIDEIITEIYRHLNEIKKHKESLKNNSNYLS